MLNATTGGGDAQTVEPADASGPVRIVDIAAELGLSVATVSRALNGVATVKPEVAEKVREHARRRGYVRNRLAKSLRSRTRTFIGFLVPDVENLAYAIAADACAKYVSRLGYQMILAISGDDPQSECAALRSLAEAQVAGLIVAPTAGITPASRALLRGRSVVEFNRLSGLSQHSVVCDDRAAFADAARHLLQLGHRSFGYIGTTDAVSNGEERLDGFRTQLQAHGHRLPHSRTRLLPPTEKDGYRAAWELLSGTRLPTALVVGSSSLSMGVARAVRELGVKVPQQMSLVVYGDSRWGALYEPALTTITAPYQLMARTVADLVADLVSAEGERRDCPVRLPAELLVRQSTGPPPGRNR
jgi:LacI family transcriptional regulator